MLELKNISFYVDDENGEKEILQNINLRIKDQEFIAITGPNGGGKSSLAKIIAGIEMPTSGTILFEGQDITNMSITDRAKAGIGFAFQQPVRFKGITIKDIVALAAGKDIDVDEACTYLAEVGLCAKDYVDREVNSSLSGGELKRIEIATLLAKNPKLAIFDEPEAGIDLWSFHNLIRVFEHMRNAASRSILIISHQERILEIADKIVVISGGKIADIGDSKHILPSLLDETCPCMYYREDMQADTL